MLADKRMALVTTDAPAAPAAPTPRRKGKRLRVLIVDEMPLTRECLTLGLAALDRGVVLHAVSGADELERTPPAKGDHAVALLNIGANRLRAPETKALIRRVCDQLHGVPLVILTDHEDIDLVLEGRRLGIRGYLVTSMGLGVALEALRLVAAGGTFVPATALDRLARGERAAPGDGAEEGSDGLTPRQLAVLEGLRQGKSNKVIAYELGMCESTVKVHVRNILRKLGAANRTQAAWITNTGITNAAPWTGQKR